MDQQNKKRSYSAEQRAEINSKRRERYRQMAPADKEALLLKRRRTGRHAPAETDKPIHEAEQERFKVLCVLCLTIPAIMHCANTVGIHVDSTGIATRRVFEVGSTSGTVKESCNDIPNINPIKGGRIKNKTNVPISQMRSQYVRLKSVPRCKYCRAKKLQFESPGFCCGSGTVKLSSHRMPIELKNLYMGTTEESKQFRTYIRTYNNMFAFTSLGVKYDKALAKRNQGIYTFRVQGQMYHFIDDLFPSDQKPKNLQLYFYDTDNELANRMTCSNKIDECIVQELIDILKINPYSTFLRSLASVPDLPNFYIALKCDSGLDQRVYNLPTTSEIAAIWVEENSANAVRPPHIRIHSSSTNRAQLLKYYYGCYDPLQYPLIFPYGEGGWRYGIKKIIQSDTTHRRHNCFEREELPSIKNMCSIDGYLEMEEQVLQQQRRKKDNVSIREYYCYKLQMRSDDEDDILHTGRLFQQYSVDEYIKVETQRLDFYTFNPDLFRVEMLQGIMDILRLGERDASNIGKQSFLPATFIGGPRDMRRRYMDAIALVQRFGKPDIFLTMTCNPSWIEIKENLISTDEVQNRPDLVSRVFRAKVEELKDDILRRNIFGKVDAFMYTIEFQKRGLPHAHFLIILANKYKLLTPESYDNIVTAELPDKDTEPDLYKLVVKHMMHGPCGKLNPANSCMKAKGNCKYKYPKEYCDQTSKGKNSYPIYRRRNTGNAVKVRDHFLDNAWVVPYNSYLLGKFDCHINVEVCSDIKVVKYIYKYICKGHDKIAFSIHSDDAAIEIDEIKEYQSARWVSPPEAMWRLYAFPISEMTPTVYHLQLHLKGQQFVSFKSAANIDSVVKNPMIKRTMLTEFFVMNRTNADAIELRLLYKDFPEYFVWSVKDKGWTRRQRHFTIGRVVTCQPTEGERYYLRLLLMNIRGPKSYKDLRTVDGVRYTTFREAAEKLGLLHSDNSLIDCMTEAVSYQMPYSLRRLFATLLVYCSPANPRELWEKFESSMSEDFKTLPSIQMKDIQNKVLNHINEILHSMGHNVNEYNLVPESIHSSREAREAKEVHFERNIIVTEADLLLEKRLNIQQRSAYNIIIARIFSNTGGAFFVDGPGGTGKTFLYRALLATVRSKGLIALATATSGVAASVLPGGRTAHSRFKIPIDIDAHFSCNISKQSSLACLIRDAKLIVWDEVSMAKDCLLLLKPFLLMLSSPQTSSTCYQGYGVKKGALGGVFDEHGKNGHIVTKL